MAAAANYARANRQLLAEAARRVFDKVTGRSLALVYDISHNLAKIETHEVNGAPRRLCVHRKGATRALPPGHPDLPADLRPTGQPVLIPGTMGTASYVLTGIPGGPAFASICHGAGRMLSRHQAAKIVPGKEVRRRLEANGVAAREASWRGLAEETPEAYKDIGSVVDAALGAGLCGRETRTGDGASSSITAVASGIAPLGRISCSSAPARVELRFDVGSALHRSGRRLGPPQYPNVGAVGRACQDRETAGMRWLAALPGGV